jgi:DNA anti-recombination protein RmuC
MSDSLLNLAGAVVIVVAGLAVLAALALIMLRALQARDQSAAQVAEFARVQADTTARIEAMRDMLAGRQGELARMVNERLDSVTNHLSQSMHTTACRSSTSGWW